MSTDEPFATWVRRYETEVLITGLTGVALIQLLSSERVSVLAMAAGAVVVPLLWLFSRTDIGSKTPAVGKPLTRATSVVVFLGILVGIVALNAVAQTGQLPIPTSQYYGAISGVLIGIFCVGVLFRTLRTVR
jgi:membrane associated rhomboid family serine protease